MTENNFSTENPASNELALVSPYKNLRDYRNQTQPTLSEEDRQKSVEYKQRVFAPQQNNLLPTYSEAQAQHILMRRGDLLLKIKRVKDAEGNPRKFLKDDGNKFALRALFQYFTQDLAFEQTIDPITGKNAGLSLAKGICLMGNVGTGKTMLLRMFSHLAYVRTWQEANINKLADLRRDGWGDQLVFDKNFSFKNIFSAIALEKEFNSTQKYDCIKHLLNLEGNQVFAIDDVGVEKNANFYGKEENLVETILMEQHKRWEGGVPFHITTNFTELADFKKRYGSRVEDRVKDMFNFIFLMGESRRG